uniref:Uncharacterized protein n=1 Tax=viral metagenome TaxID=1070528 RepID=A0A6H2A693_9ZZZZ
MSHAYLDEGVKTPIKEKFARARGLFIPGRLGFSFYIGRKELFVGFEVSRVSIPTKVKRVKRKIEHARVTFVPTRE